MTIPFALSIHNFIHNVGSDAGFAAIIGLALVVILFFAHARETSNLRDQLDAAQERIDSLERQAQQLSYQQQRATAAAAAPAAAVDPATGVMIAPRPVGMRTAAATAVGAGAVTAVAPRPAGIRRTAASIPVAQEGVGAPSLGSATRLIPDPDLPEAVTGGVAAGAVPGAVATAPNGSAAGPAAPNGSGGTAARTVPAAGGYSGSMLNEPPRRRGWLIAIGGALVAAVVVIALVVVLGSSGGNSATHTGTGAQHQTDTKKDKAPVVDPSQYRVAVLNGTAVQGLAADVFKVIGAKGFHQGAITNAATQTETQTMVYYVKSSDKAAAEKVAQTLGLPDSRVHAATAPVIQSCATNTANVKTSCNASVVVSVGSDQSKLASSGGTNSVTVG